MPPPKVGGAQRSQYTRGAMKRKKRAPKSVDFPRKKRKLGKGKRPPENVTNISFKSRSVVMPSQLEQSQQPTGKRKLALQALLSHLNHFKPSMRQDGLNGLRELFQDHPYLLRPNLAKVVGAVFVKLIDPDSSVRHSLHVFLSFLFPLVSPDHIRTFLPTIVLHLSCGLTHISDRIQLDSLKVFSLLMKHYSSLLPPHASRILPLIVGLVSRHEGTTSSAKKVTKAKLRTSLASNPSSKLSGVSSRVEIFNLLNQFLETIFDSMSDSSTLRQPSMPGNRVPMVDVCNRKVWMEKAGALEQVHSNLCNFSTSIPHLMLLQHCGLNCQSSALPLEMTSATLQGGSTGVGPGVESSVFPDDSSFLNFAEGLISLLLECWVECAPSQLLAPRSHSSSIPANTLTLMEVIIGLLCMVLKLATRVKSTDTTASAALEDTPSSTLLETLGLKYTTSFMKHFMTYFPFFSSGPSASSLRGLTMNLTLCQITALLSSSQDSSAERALQSVCAFYGTLGQKVKEIDSSSSHLVLIWCQIITESLPHLLACLESRQMEEDLKKLLGGVWAFYNACHSQSSAKKTLIQCFRNLQDKYSTKSLLFSHLLLPWLEDLPRLLGELATSSPELSALALDSLASAAPHMSLAQLGDSIIGLHDTVSQLPHTTQRRYAELLWLLPVTLPQYHSQVSQWICSEGVDITVATYVVEMMHHRFVRMRENSTSMVSSVSQYLGFMLKVLLGELGFDPKEPSGVTSESTPLVLRECTGDMECKLMLIKTVCECLRAVHYSDQVLVLVAPTLVTAFNEAICLPIDKAAAVLSLAQCLAPNGEIASQLIPLLSKLCLCVLLAWEGKRVQGAALGACLEAVQALLKGSQELLLSLFHEFVVGLAAPSSDRELRRAILHSFIALLDSTELNSSLRKHPAAIQHTASTITASLISDEQDILLRLKVSMKKFEKLVETQ